MTQSHFFTLLAYTLLVATLPASTIYEFTSAEGFANGAALNGQNGFSGQSNYTVDTDYSKATVGMGSYIRVGVPFVSGDGAIALADGETLYAAVELFIPESSNQNVNNLFRFGLVDPPSGSLNSSDLDNSDNAGVGIGLQLGSSGSYYVLDDPAFDAQSQIDTGVALNKIINTSITITRNGNDLELIAKAGAAVFAQTITDAALASDSTLSLYLHSQQGTGTLEIYRLMYQQTSVPVTLPVHQLTMDPSTRDMDSNGASDIWEAIYGVSTFNASQDSDSDGIPDGDESRYGTDPFDPGDFFKSRINPDEIAWTMRYDYSFQIEGSSDLGILDPWSTVAGTQTLVGDELVMPITPGSGSMFYRVEGTESDIDADGVADWLEPILGFSAASPSDDESAAESRSYDTTGDGNPDTPVSGDLAAFNEIYQTSSPGERMTRAQAARLLIQGTFGPCSIAEVDRVASIGVDQWLDEQINLPPSNTKPYILAIKRDLELNPGNPTPGLGKYSINDNNGNPFISGINFMSAWAQVALGAEDQLRQRVAFAMSQILVISRGGGNLANQPETIAHYYDYLLNNAFGNYHDTLLQVSLSPAMGNYLSHLGNRKEDPSVNRYPDENYAREIMQLFSIGLVELNLDGTLKTDIYGDPIPTYGNPEITMLAKVFTGTNYAASSFGWGWRDDGRYMTTPMTAFASEHDFTAKTVVKGDGATYTIPARSATDLNALKDVQDAVRELVTHPNTAPFICRQLIQLLITSNPTPAYVQRVASVFVDNGSGVNGDMEAVVRAIFTDEEARNPMEHLGTAHFGQLRESTIRFTHLSRMLNIQQYNNLQWWDWGTYRDDSLQEPMHAPTVFNYFRPDYALFGQIAQQGLDSPQFGIVNSYSSISFPNRMWFVCNNGYRHPSGSSWYDNQEEDLTELVALANDIPALLDHLSLLYCAGTLKAESRDIIATALSSEGNLTERARLAAYLVINSPEGACLK